MTQNADIQYVLLRGLARESRHWGDFPELLEKAYSRSGKHVRVDTLDLPGSGRFSEMKSPLTIREIEFFVREKFLEIRRQIRESGQKPPKKTYIIAVSLGGMIAREWLTLHPHDFDGVVLINTSFKGFSPAWKRLLPTAAKQILRIAFEKSSLERERLVLKMISNGSDELLDITSKSWASIHESRPISRENFVRQLLAAALYEPKDKNPPTHPTLVLNSECDRMVDPSCSTIIAERWNAEIKRHKTAGHDLTLDDAPWTIEQILSWESSLASRKAVQRENVAAST